MTTPWFGERGGEENKVRRSFGARETRHNKLSEIASCDQTQVSQVNKHTFDNKRPDKPASDRLRPISPASYETRLEIPHQSKQKEQTQICTGCTEQRTLPTPASPIVRILNRWSYGNDCGGGGGFIAPLMSSIQSRKK